MNEWEKEWLRLSKNNSEFTPKWKEWLESKEFEEKEKLMKERIDRILKRETKEDEKKI